MGIPAGVFHKQHSTKPFPKEVSSSRFSFAIFFASTGLSRSAKSNKKPLLQEDSNMLPMIKTKGHDEIFLLLRIKVTPSVIITLIVT